MTGRVGVIGVGLLGSALADRFLAAGAEVIVYDTEPSRVAPYASRAASAVAAAAFGEFVVLCLPDSRISAAVLDEIAPVLTPQRILVDTTTGAPAEMEAMGRRVPRYVDATIAGSSEQVRSREAAVMAGGSAGDIEACRELFDAIASRAFHVGPCGAGARMKLVVNLVLGLNRAALAEGLSFADALGMDLAVALEVLRSGPAYSTALDRKGARMLARNWTPPEARLRQHHKDVRLILAEAEQRGLRLPLTGVHDELLTAAEEAGFADGDNSAILEAFYRTGRMITPSESH